MYSICSTSGRVQSEAEIEAEIEDQMVHIEELRLAVPFVFLVLVFHSIAVL